ncbi:MAG: FAD-binding oxidoreductase [Candidatus Nomurabacteria bacterium]|jgi:FAD/FMN-containing dehydrogenase|nr:FAD-binding oxidoreductase [Candidatus Nomurabacteria bacterium]
MNRLARYLNRHISGNVYSAKRVLAAFSTDKSILEIQPKLVAVPNTTSDVRKLTRFSYELAEKGINLGLTVRGKGTDKTGAAIGNGVIVSFKEEMNKILEIDPRQKLVRVQTGVSLRELNNALSLHGLTIPIAATDRTIGGLIGNNYSGPMSYKYGGILDYVQQAEIVLSNGEVIQTEKLTKRMTKRKQSQNNFEGQIYQDIVALLEREQMAIGALKVGGELDNSGYKNIVKVDQNGIFNILPLFFGAQGTLGIVTEVILEAEYFEELPLFLAAEFPDFESASVIMHEASLLQPALMDIYEIDLMKEAEASGKKATFFDDHLSSGLLLLVGFDDHRKRARQKKINRLLGLLGENINYSVSNEDNYEDFLEIKEILSAYLNDTSGGVRVPFLDDVMVRQEYLGEFFEGLSGLEKQFGLKLPVYGSVLSNVYSVRPELNLKKQSDRILLFKLLKRYSAMVERLRGSITGGSPEGRVKAIVVEAEQDAKMAEINAEIKAIFDPKNIFNPGVKTEVRLGDVVSQLRYDYDDGIIE